MTTVTGLSIISFHARARVADYRDKPVTVVTVVTPPSAHPYALARGAADRKPVTTPRGVVSKPACKAPRTAPAGALALGPNF